MKVFWSRCGDGHGNFGDKLTPLFLDYLNIRYQWAAPERADLVGIGSLIEKIPDDYKGVIWTTGCMFQATHKELPEAEILGLRGKLTHARTVGSGRPDIVMGDGGLLCDLFFQPTKKKFKLGIIPHFADKQNSIVSRLAAANPEIRILDVCAPTLEVIQQVGECEHILSSSLHGLILADSLNVPNRWIELGADTVSGAGFKYCDYHSNFGLEDIQAVRVTGSEALNELLSGLENYRRPGIGFLKSGLRKSLSTLAERFGGTISRTKSLAQLIAGERKAAVDREMWNNQVRCAVQCVEKIIPTSAAFILIDEEQIRSEVMHAPATPFMERDGEYAGVPEDDRHAVRELRRMIGLGNHYIVIAWPAFWWLENYPALRVYLETHADSLLKNEMVQIFKVASV